MNIGFFGVTANPPHFSHCYVIDEALKSCDMVYVSLVYTHPFGKKFIAYEERHHMLSLILKEFFKNENRVKITHADKNYYEINKKTPYSYELLNFLKEMEPNNNFKLVIGSDNYSPEIWNKFYNHDKIETEFGLIVVPEKGVHSTNIREKMKEPHKNSNFLINAFGESVYEYVKNKGLY